MVRKPLQRFRALKFGSRVILALFLVTILALLGGCARKPLTERYQSMRETSAPDLDDDLPLEPLFKSIEDQILFMERSVAQQSFTFGPRTVSKTDLLAGLRRFVDLGRASPTREAFFEAVEEEFDFLEVYGQKNWGEVFMTSYYEPVVPGSLKPTKRFSQALYRQPDDLLMLDLGQFDEKFTSERKLRARISGNKVLPYFTREEIDVADALKGKGLELCWVEPLDAYIIQVQGSAVIDLGEGKQLRIGYGEKNGHRYESLANHLSRFIPKEKMSLQGIEAHLKSLPEAEMQRYLNLNRSYVFFKVLSSTGELFTGPVVKAVTRGKTKKRSPVFVKPPVLPTDPLIKILTVEEASALRGITFLGVPATDGRTIATDPKYFPKGALAFLVGEKPKFDTADAVYPSGTETFRRFVLDQDIGGAITGGGRLDLFWGQGSEAKRFAGAMKNQGKLYYLVPKPRD